MDSVESTLSRIRGRRVLVLGDAILDEYVLGDCSRISPEAPVPVLRVNSVRRVLGGAANTAANVVSLGGIATLIAVIGPDDTGAALTQLAADAGVDFRPVTGRAATLRKTRVVGQQQQIVRLDYEDADRGAQVPDQDIVDAFDASVGGSEIIVISDYAKGFVSQGLSETLIQRAHAAGLQVVVDPRPSNRRCYVGCDYVTPNWREARALLAQPDVDQTSDNVRATARALAAELGSNVLLTLGRGGMAFCARDGAEQLAVPTFAREVFDVSGAGDTVVAAFSLALAGGLGHESAIVLANGAASVAVGKFGTSTVHAHELAATDQERQRLLGRAALAPLSADLRSKGQRIVTINGSFDVLHPGHLHILAEAKKQGDVLIVGVNSDTSVSSYKGPNRPILPEAQRAEMLLALRVVDYVHVFSETDPRAFLAAVKPDVHVNGEEYGADCIERDVVEQGGGRIHLVKRIPGLSTSEIVAQASPDKIRARS